jgi:hypothetical protein
MLNIVRQLRKEFEDLGETIRKLPTPRVQGVQPPTAPSQRNSADALRRGQLDELVTELRKRL